MILYYHTAAWRDRQTHAPQERVGAIPCGFESRGRDHFGTCALRNASSYMEDATMRRVTRHAGPAFYDEVQEAVKATIAM